jgi:hypothetical protein
MRKQYIFSAADRNTEKRQIVKLIGRDAYRKMVYRKWTLRKIERTS